MVNGIKQQKDRSGMGKIEESYLYVYDVEKTLNGDDGYQIIGSHRFGSEFFHGTYGLEIHDLKNGNKLSTSYRLVKAPKSWIEKNQK